MKKLFAFFMFVGMIAFLACGPSAEEKAAKEKATQDSIAAAKEKATQDSIMFVMEKAKADSIAAAAIADSIQKAEAAKKPAKKTNKNTEPKKIEKKDVKVGQGKNAK